MEELMIKIENVSKQYKLGEIGGTTLRDELQRRSARRHGREDPTRKIGAKNYNKGEIFKALDGVSFDVKKGERVGIIGHNGAGKSTLLKLISRVTAPSGGRIGLNGRVASMLEVGTGFHGELTGRENIYMNGAILGMTRKEIDAKIEDIIDFSECRQFIDTPVKRYSSGMYVKLAFSVAAHLDSEIMIMDEVLAVGDMAFQKKCLEKMSDVSRAEGRTILYVSHNMNTIRQLCDRVIVLDHGKVKFDGDVEEGILIYLNVNTKQEGTYYDLLNKQRPNNKSGKAKLLSFEFLNTDDCIYSCGTPIRFKIVWTSTQNINQVFFRMIIRYVNDAPVGLAQSSELRESIIDDNNENTFEFDTILLPEGVYYLSIALFQRDRLGNSIILDHITRACKFEIINDKKSDNCIKWEHQWWGSVNFPKLREVN